MKTLIKKIIVFLQTVFGYGITVALFAGGLTFFGYVAALIIGGSTAALICAFLYETIIPIIIKISTIMVLLGIFVMYLNGEVALTSNNKESAKHESEM